MAYDNLPASKPATRRKKTDAVFCVGWRAFVNWRPRGLNTMPVPMRDMEGRPMPNDLVDGQPVEILSWRPRASEGTLYQIRRLADGSEWWIGSQYLRKERQPVPPATAAND